MDSKTSALFKRLFNQFTPLPEGHLKDTIVALLNKHGLKLKGIYVRMLQNVQNERMLFAVDRARKKKFVLMIIC